MQDLLKFDPKEIAAIAIIFLLAFGIGSFPPKSTLPDYSTAIAMQAAAFGQQAAFHIQVASFFEQLYASFLGMPANSPDATVSFLLFWPSKLFALTGIFLYLALRALGFRKTVAAFSAILFILSQVAILSFLPGVFGSASIGAVLFSLFFLFIALYSRKGHAAWLALSALFGAFCAYSDFGFGIAALAASALFAAAAYMKKEKNAICFAAVAAASAVALALAPNPVSFLGLPGLQSLFTGAPFLFAAASCALVLLAFSSATLESALLVLGAIAVSAASPLAGAILLTVPAAEGISRAIEGKAPTIAKLACAFFLAFFLLFGLASYAYSDLLSGVVMALMLAVLSPLLLHFYEYKSRRFFALLAIVLVALSLFTVVLYPVSSHKADYPSYSDNDEAAALSYLSGKNAGSVCFLGVPAMASFYLPGATACNQSQFGEYLLTGASPPGKGELLLSLSYLDYPAEYGLAGGEAQFESFAYASNTTGSNGAVAVFSSASGGLLVREIEASGSLSLGDGQIIDPYGRAYGTVPLSRMLLLLPNESFSSQQNRLIVLAEGASLPEFLKVYSGKASGLSFEKRFGKVSVYGVE